MVGRHTDNICHFCPLRKFQDENDKINHIIEHIYGKWYCTLCYKDIGWTSMHGALCHEHQCRRKSTVDHITQRYVNLRDYIKKCTSYNLTSELTKEQQRLLLFTQCQMEIDNYYLNIRKENIHERISIQRIEGSLLHAPLSFTRQALQTVAMRSISSSLQNMVSSAPWGCTRKTPNLHTYRTRQPGHGMLREVLIKRHQLNELGTERVRTD